MIYAIGVAGNIVICNYFQIWTACRYFLFFWIGYKIRQHGISILYKISPIAWLLIQIVIFIVMKFIPKEGFYFTVLTIIWDIILYSVGAIMSFVVLQKIAMSINWQNNRIVKQLQAESMSIYLFHQQLIYFSIIFFNGLVGAYIHALINFLIALIGSLLIGKVLMSNKYSRFLVGEG